MEDYGDDFISHLDKNLFYFPPEAQENYVYYTAYSYLSQMIKADIDKTVENATHKALKISAAKIQQIIQDIVKKEFESITALPRIDTLPTSFEKEIVRKYYKITNQAIDDVFQKLPLSAAVLKQLKRICVALFVNDMSRLMVNTSGIVIAGFGEQELYPTLVSYEIECVINDRLKYKRHSKTAIHRLQTAALVPFAQQEMVISFMVGVAPAYKDALTEYLTALFDKYPEELIKEFTHLTAKKRADLLAKMKKTGVDLASAFWKNVNGWSRENNIDLILSAVSVLPKDELASMAESLVNLTSFKRRVTLDAETVGGPIDVAVISKGDGFIWISRKHYFEAANNPHFLKNYYR